MDDELETFLPAGEEGSAPTLDVLVVPGLLLLVARDLLLFDPPRILGWRLSHDPRLASTPEWLNPLLPRPSGALDRDPIALLLAALLSGLAIVYLCLGLRRTRVATRGALLGLAGLGLVVIPTVAFMVMGFATDRPFGQDGGVVQLPLAIDRILSGKSPYGADYSDSILGKQARVSDFWEAWGGNPILRHHAYLPGTHLLMIPAYWLSRETLGAFDPRFVTLLGFAVAALLAFRVAGGGSRGLVGAAVVAVNPLVYWQQIFGAGDVMVAMLLLFAVLLAEQQRSFLAAAALGFACATKQLAWPYAPFLLVHLAGARSLRELTARGPLGRLLRGVLVSGGTFLVVVMPVAALDWRAFWGDVIVYNAGLPGADNYPLGGTPGFGFANFLIYFGAVASLNDYFPFGLFYVLLIPLGLLLLRAQMRQGSAGAVLVTGSAALVASLYFSRVVHPNYLILAAILLPVGALAARRWPADVVVAPLLLLMLGVEIAEQELFRTLWEDAVSVRMPAYAWGLARQLLPRAGSNLTRDPLGLLFSALAAGLGVMWLMAGLLGASGRRRRLLAFSSLVLLVLLPTLLFMRVGEATGVPRGQDPWLATLSEPARRTAGQSEPPPPREAWSCSLRLDPPRELVATSWATLPGEKGLALVLGLTGLVDPRWLSLAAVALVTLPLLRREPAARQLLWIGIVLLSSLAVTGVVFGAGDLLALAGLLGSWRLMRSGHVVACGLTTGLTVAAFPRVFFAAPFLLVGEWRGRGARPFVRWCGSALLGFLLLSVPSWVVLGTGEERPFIAGNAGLGLGNLMAYRGVNGGDAWQVLVALAVGLVALVAAARSAPWPEERRFVAGGTALLAGLWVTPGVSAHSVLLPLALLLQPYVSKVTALDSPPLG